MANETQAYQWSGINAQGKRASGVINAADTKEAQSELKKMSIEVISLTPKSQLSFSRFLSKTKQKKIKIADILLFTRYISMMLAAGLPMLQALDIIARDQDNPTMQAMILAIKNNIAGGKTLAESFSQYPDQFSDLYCNLIKTGEKSGTLDKILLRLGNYMERTENLKRKVKKALIYPVAILTVALLVSLVLLIFVVPQFQTMFKSFGAELPFFTRIVVNMSEFMRAYWYLLLLAIGAGLWGVRRLLKHNKRVQLLIDKWSLRIYIIGPIMRKSIIARFTRTLATTLDAGMPIVESMKAMPAIMGNSIYGEAVDQMRTDLTSGHQLSVAMGSTQLFPNMAIQMIAVGEASGSLADMLNKVADHYEDEVNYTVDNLSSLLEPIIMLILGIVVGGFVIAMYMPIFKIGSLF